MVTTNDNATGLRWWGAAAGVALGLIDTATLAWLGTSFQMNGRDVSVLVAAFFASSFALLGFLVGLAVEGRRRERQAAATIRRHSDEIASTRARLAQSEKLAALGQLAAAIAHEVRNPLAVIRSAAQGLGETTTGGDTGRACAFITAEIDRLGAVINSLLAFARPPRIEPREVRIADLFDRALLLVRNELEAKQLHVDRREPAYLPALRADSDLLCQVLLDLLANAAEAVPPGGAVALEARATDDAIELSVADSGPGVPPELRERVFEPFFTTRTRGTGLGLAIARQIVEAHGGQIVAGSRPEGGACFTVRLPLAAAA